MVNEFREVFTVSQRSTRFKVIPFMVSKLGVPVDVSSTVFSSQSSSAKIASWCRTTSACLGESCLGDLSS